MYYSGNISSNSDTEPIVKVGPPFISTDLIESALMYMLRNIVNQEKLEIKEKKSEEYLGRKYNIFSILNDDSKLLYTVDRKSVV